jgi:hypothetical protein
VLMEIEELAIKRGLVEARSHAVTLINSPDISRVIAEELHDGGFISNEQFQETMVRIKRKREEKFSGKPSEEELARKAQKKKQEEAAEARRLAIEQKKKEAASQLAVKRRLDGERKERIRLREYDGEFEVFIKDCATNNIEGVKVALEKHGNKEDDITNRQLATSITGPSAGQPRWADCTGLMVASRFGHAELVKLLLTSQPDTETSLRDKSGRCALHWAAEYGQVAVIRALHAVDHNILDTTGATPLMLAVRGDFFDAVSALLLNSDINVRDKTASTALMQACDQGNPKVTRKLLDYSADIDTANLARRTALMHCARWGHAKVSVCCYWSCARPLNDTADLLLFASNVQLKGSMCQQLPHSRLCPTVYPYLRFDHVLPNVSAVSGKLYAT